jgi:hypothetical protein
MIIFVLDDGETYTLADPVEVVVTPEQLTRIESGEKVYQVVPDWAEQSEKPEPLCNCMQCTRKRWPYQSKTDAPAPEHTPEEDAEDFFVQAGIAAAEALKEMKRDYTKSIVDAQNKGGE